MPYLKAMQPRTPAGRRAMRSLRFGLFTMGLFAFTAWMIVPGPFSLRYLLPVSAIGFLFGVTDFAFRGLQDSRQRPRLLLSLLEFPVAFGFPMSVALAWVESAAHPGANFFGRFAELWGMFLLLGGLLVVGHWWLTMKWRSKHP